MSIYDKRFFVKILKVFIKTRRTDGRNNQTIKALKYLTRLGESWRAVVTCNHSPQQFAGSHEDRFVRLTQVTILPIEHKLLCSALLCSGRCKNSWENVDSNSRPKMSCNLFQMLLLSTNIKSLAWSKSGYNTKASTFTLFNFN